MLKQNLKSQQSFHLDVKTSRREMIGRSLMELPQQRGTKKEILKKIENIYNTNLREDTPIYKSLE